MDPKSPEHSTVKHLRLPSGKTIEVVVLGERGGDSTLPPPRQAHDLHVCPECASELVQPVEWEQLAPDRWQLELRCPDCGWEIDDVFDTGAVEEFDERLERDTQSLLHDLHQLSAANLEEEIERFVAALQSDLILPSDF